MVKNTITIVLVAAFIAGADRTCAVLQFLTREQFLWLFDWFNASLGNVLSTSISCSPANILIRPLTFIPGIRQNANALLDFEIDAHGGLGMVAKNITDVFLGRGVFCFLPFEFETDSDLGTSRVCVETWCEKYRFRKRAYRRAWPLLSKLFPFYPSWPAAVSIAAHSRATTSLGILVSQGGPQPAPCAIRM